MVDTTHAFVENVCGTEMDIVYLPAAFGLYLFTEIR